MRFLITEGYCMGGMRLMEAVGGGSLLDVIR